MSILIVDDSELSAKMLEIALKKRGFETLYAKDGKEALEILQHRGDVEVVVTDLVMPEMDGLELVAKIRSSPDLCGLAVILCSVAADESRVRKAATLGCKHYLVKPVSPKALVERVEEALRESKPNLSSPKEIMERFGIDSATYEELKAKFIYSLEGILQALEGSSQSSSPDLQVALSRLSEEATIFGAKRLLDAMEKEEGSADGGASCGGSKTNAIKVEIRRLLKFLCSNSNSTRPF